MTPIMLRQLWTLIETTQATVLLTLDDSSLIQWLLRQLRQEQNLDNQDAYVLSDYIQSKLTLIRDLAHERSTAAS